MRYAEARQAAFQELMVQVKTGYLSVPCLLGPVGIGKTDMAVDLSIMVGEAIDDTLVMEAVASGESADPTDTTGLPWVIPIEDNAETRKLFKVLWVLNRAALQACQVPTMLLFDDIDKAVPIVVNSLLNLFVHRRFKDFRLHPHSVLACAGNRPEDDRSAAMLNESILGRITAIEVDANLEDFAEYGNRIGSDGKPLIHPLIIGFLTYKPSLLHNKQEGYRFPNPRSYREASIHMQHYPDPKGWKGLLERKIGPSTATTFWSWYTILSKVDVDYILREGKLHSIDVSTYKDADVAKAMAEFAAVFAVIERLRNDYKAGHKGLERFLGELTPELQAAFLLQFPKDVRSRFRRDYPTAAGKILASIIKDDP